MTVYLYMTTKIKSMFMADREHMMMNPKKRPHSSGSGPISRKRKIIDKNFDASVSEIQVTIKNAPVYDDDCASNQATISSGSDDDTESVEEEIIPFATIIELLGEQWLDKSSKAKGRKNPGQRSQPSNNNNQQQSKSIKPKNRAKPTGKSDSTKIEKIPNEDDKSIVKQEYPDSNIFVLLTLPCRASYQKINKNFFKFIDLEDKNSARKLLDEIKNNATLYAKYNSIITLIYRQLGGMESFFPIDCGCFYEMVNQEIKQMKTDPNMVGETKQLSENIIDKMLARYFPFDGMDDNPNELHLKKIRLFRDFMINPNDRDPLLANARPADFKPGTTAMRKLTFKCWTCKYYYQIGRTQQEFYQFQFKDFCSIQCLSANVNTNGHCTFCYKKNRSNLANEPKLDWSQCPYSFTYYHPNDIGRDYLEIFHNETHQREYLEGNRFCQICKQELIENFDEIHQIRVSERTVLNFCSKHSKEYRTRCLKFSPQISCTICHKTIPQETLCEDQFYDGDDNGGIAKQSSKWAFCTKTCKLLFFKVHHYYNRCATCYQKLVVDSSKPDFRQNFYLIRCFWTLYMVCSSKCYFNFRYDYRFHIKCHNCSMIKYHSDMIGVMPYHNEIGEPLEEFIKHYCSLGCLKKHRTESELSFHPLPLIRKKYRYDIKLERDVIQAKCQTCCQTFNKCRGSPLSVCSWQCFSSLFAKRKSQISAQRPTAEQLCDEIFCSEIAKKKEDEQLKRKKSQKSPKDNDPVQMIIMGKARSRQMEKLQNTNNKTEYGIKDKMKRIESIRQQMLQEQMSQCRISRPFTKQYF